MTGDPVKSARLWVAENPQEPGAAHVLAALASAERYRVLAEEQEKSTGARVVLCTLEGERVVLTSPKQATDERVASLLGAMLYSIGCRHPKKPLPLVWWRLAAEVLRMHVDHETTPRCDDYDWPEWFPVDKREPLVRAMAEENERTLTGAEKAAYVDETVEMYARGPSAPGSNWIAGFFVRLIAEMGGEVR